MPTPRVPKSVKVGPHVYRIVGSKDPKLEEQKINGLCEDDDLKITLRNSLKRTRKQEVMVHELCHACVLGTDVPVEFEEKLVDLMANRWLQVLRDNPELVEYLRS